jgi:hypothetical protein
MDEVIYFLGMRLEYWSLFIAGIAILFTLLKDFILPSIIKPRLKITYLNKEPYKRAPIILYPGSILSAFDRFKVENIGKVTAKNCRCQIYQIKDSKGKEVDLQGFPLRWASRPDSGIDFTKAERLNIGPGENEFVDLLYMRTDDTTKMFLSSYHNAPIGMGDSILLDSYTIKAIISGDNFKPYIATFKVSNKIELNGFNIKLEKIKRK